MKNKLLQFIERVEKNHFRTTDDTGANPNAMIIWNMLREHAGLPRITVHDLPAWNGMKYEMPKESKLLTNKDVDNHPTE